MASADDCYSKELFLGCGSALAFLLDLSMLGLFSMRPRIQLWCAIC